MEKTGHLYFGLTGARTQPVFPISREYFRSKAGFRRATARNPRLPTKEPIFAFRLRSTAYAVAHSSIVDGGSFQLEGGPVFLFRAESDGLHESTRVFESGAILVYLAEKFGQFLPTEPAARAECLSWLFWQMGSVPYLGGGFGHFYAYAPEKYEYPINRYAMEVKRQLDVLDRNLASRRYLCGDDYNVADIANYAWYGALVLHNIYEAEKFLDVASYKNVVRWAKEIEERPAVRRGRRVNRAWGPEEEQVLERHSASDLD